MMTAPVLARNSNAQQTDDGSAPPRCHTLQKGPDGAWVEIPCQELGSPAQLPSKHLGRSAEKARKGIGKRSPDEEAEPSPGPSS
jgi:hypothetical protein